MVPLHCPKKIWPSANWNSNIIAVGPPALLYDVAGCRPGAAAGSAVGPPALLYGVAGGRPGAAAGSAVKPPALLYSVAGGRPGAGVARV